MRDRHLKLPMNRRLILAAAINAAILAVGVGVGLTISVMRHAAPAPAPRASADRPEPGEPPTPELPPWLDPDQGAERYWPVFRGPNSDARAIGQEWPQHWDGEAGENVVWKADVPLDGKSSPVVWGGKVFLTAADEDTQLALCYGRETGDLLWRTEIPPSPERDWPAESLRVFPETGYAAPTPAVDRYAMYAIYASGDVAALDHEGALLWSRNLGEPASAYGFATSLALYGDNVLVQYDVGLFLDEADSALHGLDRRTGRTAWRTPRPVPNSWSTPTLARTPAGPRLFTAADPWTIAYDPADGREIWRTSGLAGDVAPAPVYAAGVVYVTNEYAQMLAIRDGGEGDVTDTHVLWTAEEGLSDAATPLHDGERLLQIHSGGYMTCYDPETGELLWTEEVDGPIWASPILAGGLVYLPLADRQGTTLIFDIADGYALRASPALGQPVSAIPAFVDGDIFIRGHKSLFRIKQP